MESESLLPLVRVTVADDREPETSFLVLIVVLTSKMFCRMKTSGSLRPRQERQIKLKPEVKRQSNPRAAAAKNRKYRVTILSWE